MKFGVFSVSMPEYGIEESVRLLKELGYDGVEWRVAEMPEKEPENVPFALRYWACNKSTLELRSIEAEAAKAKALCDEARINGDLAGSEQQIPDRHRLRVRADGRGCFFCLRVFDFHVSFLSVEQKRHVPYRMPHLFHLA